MGTAGIVTIIYKGKYYTCYNSHDSYYSGLGKCIIIDLINIFKKNPIDYDFMENITFIYAEGDEYRKILQEQGCDLNYTINQSKIWYYTVNTDYICDYGSFTEYSYTINCDDKEYICTNTEFNKEERMSFEFIKECLT